LFLSNDQTHRMGKGSKELDLVSPPFCAKRLNGNAESIESLRATVLNMNGSDGLLGVRFRNGGVAASSNAFP